VDVDQRRRKVFEGHKLTIDEYERVETAYVDAFVAFAEDSDVERLEVRSLETDDGLEEGASVSLGLPDEIREYFHGFVP
jgi:hypothetical protein